MEWNLKNAVGGEVLSRRTPNRSGSPLSGLHGDGSSPSDSQGHIDLAYSFTGHLAMTTVGFLVLDDVLCHL